MSEGKGTPPLLERLLKNAARSPLDLWILNQALKFIIPFNRPHGIVVKQLSGAKTVTYLPYRYSNYNHLKGIHACALAAAAEFSTGLTLLSRLSASEYRIIMQHLAMTYHYQARTHALAECFLGEDRVKEGVLVPLETADQVIVEVEAMVHDIDGNHLCTGSVTWQIKKWSKVKTTR